jgi:hypothetical protein
MVATSTIVLAGIAASGLFISEAIFRLIHILVHLGTS